MTAPENECDCASCDHGREVKALRAEAEAALKLAEACRRESASLYAERDAANLQNGELKNSLRHLLDVCHDYLTHKDQQNVAAYLQAAKEALEPLTPVEGKPGEVCGPCGVAHPVVEKPVREVHVPSDHRPGCICASGFGLNLSCQVHGVEKRVEGA